MGPEDSNFPREIPAIPAAGGQIPGGSPPQPPEDSPDEARGSTPEVWSEVDRGTPRSEDRLQAASEAEPSPAAPIPTDRAQASANWVEAELPYHPKPLSTLDEILIVLTEGVTLWRGWLRWLRSQLPAPWRGALSDQLLTAILLGFGVLLLAVANPFGGRSTPPLSRPTPSPVGPVAAVVGPNPAVDQPPPTPEASLMADLETQLSPITRSYGVDLIDAVEVNLPRQTLTIHLGESWYGLQPSQQDRIAQDIYRQAQDLHLDRLALQDPEERVVARSPVVGTTMVVLQRRRPGVDLPPV